MASGISATCRQVGIATAVAALGSIFAHGLAGSSAKTIAGHYSSTLNELLLIAAITALVTGTLSLGLIRQRDFVAHGAPPAPQPAADRQPVAG
jgi:hypothetical protein